MRFSSLIAIALIAVNVEAVELHSHQKVAAGARTHQRKASPAKLSLAQQKSMSAAQLEKFNFDKLKQKLAKAKSWSAEKAAEVKADAEKAKASIDSGDWAGALEGVKGDMADLGADAKAAVTDVQDSAAEVQE